MIRRLTFTKDHIKLLKLLKFDYDEKEETLLMEKINPYMLPGRLEDLAMALGYQDKMIPGTEEDAEGAAFPDEVEDYLLEVHKYIIDNLHDIEVLIHQKAFEKECIGPGTYKFIESEGRWKKEKKIW